MTISDVKILADRGYEIVTKLGEGAYSKVKLFHSKHLQKQVAGKIINKSLAPKDFVENFLPREIEILQHIRHPHIVDIYEILATNDGRIFIIMEYANKGDLLKFIQMNGALDEKRSRLLFTQLGRAIAYLHAKNIVHRDLKCENLLLTHVTGPRNEDLENTKNMSSGSLHTDEPYLPEGKFFDMSSTKLLLTDFGFSRRFTDMQDRSRTFCGSAAYAAPEIIKGEPYHPKQHDMWSLGVVLFIMVCGTMPYDDSNIRKMLREQLNKTLRFPPQAAQALSMEVKDLIQKLIEPDAAKRYDVETVLQHAWIREAKDGVNQRQSSVKDRSSERKSKITSDTSEKQAFDNRTKLWW